MTHDISYTTEEIAKLLKISKLTVYDLIKRGELPAYRVGKQMRVDAADLEAYKQKAKGVLAQAAGSSPAGAPMQASEATPSAFARDTAARSIVITGQDISLDILARHIGTHTGAAVRPLRSHAGSLDSLMAMYRGEADIVSTHLLDGDTGEYNVPYIRKLLVGIPCIVIRMLSRNAGLYTAKGNPKKIEGWRDLRRPDIRIVNREIGSGTRVLLDEQLRLRGIRPNEVSGYAAEESNHLGVAGKVAVGAADTGCGIEKAAAIVGVDFIPLIREQYDLVILKTPANAAWLDPLIRILRSGEFQRELSSIPGYDLTETGQIVWEA